MKLSHYGEQMAGPSAIADLMQDLGEALNTNPNVLFLGGGNPALIPEAHTLFTANLMRLLEAPDSSMRWLGVYQSPQGSEALLSVLAEYLQQQGWPIFEKNLVVLNGGQTAFHRLLNIFGGQGQRGINRIHLPMVPEYVGYRGQMNGGDAFTVGRPLIKRQPCHRFDYELDRNALQLNERSGAICISRPTNPSAKVLDNNDLDWLRSQARNFDIPMIVDCAYGAPFPNIIDAEQAYRWQSGDIAVLSLSKLGLPGLRTAIVVADEPVVQLLTKMGAIENLAAGNTGPLLLESLIKNGDLARLTKLVPNFYVPKRALMLKLLDEHLKATPYQVHNPDGAFFVWLWLPELPISTRELYQRLKQKNVLVMAGEDFFFGEATSWQHARECLRLNICQSDDDMTRALEIIGNEIRALYQ